MSDIVPKAKRSEMMANIKAKNTRPERFIRTGLHRMGFRFRLHPKNLPGKPDIVLPRFRSVIFVNGCFWHYHQCHLFKLPSTRTEFWRRKLSGNRERDLATWNELLNEGWNILVIWECAMKGKYRRDPDELLNNIADWLKKNEPDPENEIVKLPRYDELGSLEQGVSPSG